MKRWYCRRSTQSREPVNSDEHSLSEAKWRGFGLVFPWFQCQLYSVHRSIEGNSLTWHSINVSAGVLMRNPPALFDFIWNWVPLMQMWQPHSEDLSLWICPKSPLSQHHIAVESQGTFLWVLPLHNVTWRHTLTVSCGLRFLIQGWVLTGLGMWPGISDTWSKAFPTELQLEALL